MMDQTEATRRELAQQLNSEPGTRETLEARYGQVWDTEQLQQDFDVIGFRAPFVIVRRKTDNIGGSLLFQHDPRFYFQFE